MTQVQIPEMSCRELVELVTDYLDGALAAGDVARLEDHLDGCDGCRAYLEQMRDTIAALGHLPPESPSPVAKEKLMAVFIAWRDDR
jgi:predicted anti-sigma-YlaC factor YlaD